MGRKLIYLCFLVFSCRNLQLENILIEEGIIEPMVEFSISPTDLITSVEKRTYTTGNVLISTEPVTSMGTRDGDTNTWDSYSDTADKYVEYVYSFPLLYVLKAYVFATVPSEIYSMWDICYVDFYRDDDLVYRRELVTQGSSTANPMEKMVSCDEFINNVRVRVEGIGRTLHWGVNLHEVRIITDQDQASGLCGYSNGEIIHFAKDESNTSILHYAFKGEDVRIRISENKMGSLYQAYGTPYRVHHEGTTYFLVKTYAPYAN